LLTPNTPYTPEHLLCHARALAQPAVATVPLLFSTGRPCISTGPPMTATVPPGAVSSGGGGTCTQARAVHP
jgi:hypothetical protein